MKSKMEEQTAHVFPSPEKQEEILRRVRANSDMTDEERRKMWLTAPESILRGTKNEKD